VADDEQEKKIAMRREKQTELVVVMEDKKI
jgi:hypothetical protein